jgi:hypothetical protein
MDGRDVHVEQHADMGEVGGNRSFSSAATMTKTTKALPVKYTSDFALLDIKQGRSSLKKVTDAQQEDVRIPVTIKGFITHRHGGDDGTSIEFGVEVISLKIKGGK